MSVSVLTKLQYELGMKTTVIVNIIIFMTTMCEAQQTEILRMSLHGEPYFNSYISNLSFALIQPCGFIQCQTHCLLRSRCLSINYDRQQSMCMLNVVMATSNLQTLSGTQYGRIYKDIGQIKKNPKLIDLIGTCKDHVCPVNTKCVVLTSQRPYCMPVKSDASQEGSRVQEWTFENKYECCNTLANGVDYNGLVNVTKSGIPCQMWKSNFPHSHDFGVYLQETDKNYCRNPDTAPWTWCYTTDPDDRWDVCNIPTCTPRRFEWKGCYLTENGTDYVGTMRYTTSGFFCQRWDSQTPNAHSFTDVLSGNNHNYCRNPDNKKQPWCFTLPRINGDEQVWDYCDVPKC